MTPKPRGRDYNRVHMLQTVAPMGVECNPCRRQVRIKSIA